MTEAKPPKRHRTQVGLSAGFRDLNVLRMCPDPQKDPKIRSPRTIWEIEKGLYRGDNGSIVISALECPKDWMPKTGLGIQRTG